MMKCGYELYWDNVFKKIDNLKKLGIWWCSFFLCFMEGVWRVYYEGEVLGYGGGYFSVSWFCIWIFFVLIYFY